MASSTSVYAQNLVPEDNEFPEAPVKSSQQHARSAIMRFLLGRQESGTTDKTEHLHQRVSGGHKSHIPHMKETLEADAELRAAFTEYGRVHFINDSLRFLEDLIEYRSYFWEKNMKWRTHKINVLYTSYIETTAALEINLSSACRQRCMKRVQAIMAAKPETLDCKELFEVFEEAEKQVTNMIQDGAWRSFMSDRRQRRGSSAGTASTTG